LLVSRNFGINTYPEAQEVFILGFRRLNQVSLPEYDNSERQPRGEFDSAW